MVCAGSVEVPGAEHTVGRNVREIFTGKDKRTKKSEPVQRNRTEGKGGTLVSLTSLVSLPLFYSSLVLEMSISEIFYYLDNFFKVSLSCPYQCIHHLSQFQNKEQLKLRRAKKK